MMTENRKSDLLAIANHHDAIAIATAAPRDMIASAAHAAEAARLVASAERMNQSTRGDLVQRARQSERMALAAETDPDMKVTLNHAQAAEDLRAIVEERPSRRLTINDVRPVALIEKEPAAAATMQEIASEDQQEVIGDSQPVKTKR